MARSPLDDSDNGDMIQTRGSRPVPDPTVLTTRQLLQAVASLKELFETRLNAMDKAIILLQAFADRQPTTTAVSQAVDALAQLTNERFDNVRAQLHERDLRFDLASRDREQALSAALSAAKELVSVQNNSNNIAVDKSSIATTRQIDSIVQRMENNTKTSDDKINDLKDRITIVESTKRGGGEVWGTVMAVIAVMISGSIAFIMYATR